MLSSIRHDTFLSAIIVNPTKKRYSLVLALMGCVSGNRPPITGSLVMVSI